MSCELATFKSSSSYVDYSTYLSALCNVIFNSLQFILTRTNYFLSVGYVGYYLRLL